MPRPKRIQFPGAVYHITSGGKEGNPVFSDEKDFTLFLSILKNVVLRYNWLCHVYCLMPNHYHLVIETPEANLSRGMRQLNGVFTQRFNKRHKRSGTIFQGRYESVVIEKEKYLVELSRYVLLNPVRSNIVENLSQWKWSSFRTMVGQKGEQWFDLSQWILTHFGQDQEKAMKAYEHYVAEGRGEPLSWQEVKRQAFLGSVAFEGKIKGYMNGKGAGYEALSKKSKYLNRPDLKKIFEAQEKDKESRNQSIYTAHKDYGYTLSEIGRFLELHYTTISKAFQNMIIKKKKK